MTARTLVLDDLGIDVAPGEFLAIVVDRVAAEAGWTAGPIQPPTPTSSVASGGSNPRRGGHHASRPATPPGSAGCLPSAGREVTTGALIEGAPAGTVSGVAS